MSPIIEEHGATPGKRLEPAVPDLPVRIVRLWAAPALFALALQVTIRQHSWAPVSTLTVAAANIALLAGLLFLFCHLIDTTRIRVSRSAVGLLAMLAVSVTLSLLASEDPARSFTRLRLYGAVALLAASIYLLHRQPAAGVPVVPYFIAIGVLHLPYAIDVALWMRDAKGSFWLESMKVPHFSHVRQFAETCFLASTCSLAIALSSRRLAVTGFVLTCVALFGTIATGSRGALLSWIAFACVFAIIAPWRWRTVLVAAAALVISGATVWQLHTSGLLESPNLFARVSAGLQKFDSGRKEIWISSLAYIREAPILGHGPEAYRISGCCDRTVSQPHNFVLQFVMEFGLAGCALFALLVWKLIKSLGGPGHVWRAATGSTETAILLSFLAAFLAYALIDGVLYHAIPLMAFALLCGLLAASISNFKDAAPQAARVDRP